MKQIIQLAWRNIWRKRKRSFIALLSVTFAVLLAICFRSLQWGSYEKMIEAGARNSGYIQIHAENYWEDKSINDLFEDTDQLRKEFLQTDNINRILPRLQNVSLAANEERLKGTMVIGIDPKAEDDFNHLSNKITEGDYLNNQSKGILIAEGLAEYLALKTGDTLVLFGQGFHGSFAAGKYPIEGILQFSNPQLNNAVVYMPLTIAQEYNGAYGMVSAYMLDVTHQDETEQTSRLLQNQFHHFEIMRWDEMQPSILDSIKTDTSIAALLLSCLYVIVGFGVIGTITMMALERKREFGTLHAIGLQKRAIQLMLITEASILGILGLILAFCIAIPVVWYMHHHPIPLSGESAKSFEAMGAAPVLQFAIKPSLFLINGLIVFGIMLLACLLPAIMIRKLRLNLVIK